MKNKSLTLQIWLVISAILLLVSILLSLLFPTTLRHFFTDEIYTSIENEQEILQEFRLPRNTFPFDAGAIITPDSDRSVTHMVITQDVSFVPRYLPAEFIEAVRNQALQQAASVQRYSQDMEHGTLFYVIRKVQIYNQSAFLLSFTWDEYRNDLVYALFSQLLIVMGVVFLLSWIPSLWLAKYLSRPLVTLERHVKKIAQKDWYDPVNVDRNDEIGQLAMSIESMRDQLVEKDETQQTLIQNVSHDLKTPVMVIRSYAQAIKDGIYPKGDLGDTVRVIEDEAERLEKRIRNLLYLTKLDYMEAHERIEESIELKTLIEAATERFRWSRTELTWVLDLYPVTITGEVEQWNKVLENVLDNQLRYAEQEISISLRIVENHVLLRVWNDGPAIEATVKEQLFEQFHKGDKGEFGLGLAIVQRIAKRHHAHVWMENEDGGAACYVRIPLAGHADRYL